MTVYIKIIVLLILFQIAEISSEGVTIIKSNNDAGPLLLTPLIESNKIDEARWASQVNFSEFGDVKSYSGYFTVNKLYDSNIFFWFFPSESDYEDDPVLLWLQGGPGAASVFGLFREHGPFSVLKDEFSFRNFTWSKSHSILYLDNPVGTGFSFTNGGYAQNETQVGEELYKTLQQFFTLFPELQRNDFYVTGESYAGKYVPAISYTIHKKNPDAELKINLKGLAVGNGLIDPENQLYYGDYLYQLGVIDSNVLEVFHDYEERGRKLIQENEYLKAFDLFDTLINSDLTSDTIYRNATGFDTNLNYLDPNFIDTTYIHYIERMDVRTAIHVGNATYHTDDKTVEKNLLSDIMQSTVPWLAELANNYRVLLYNGQMDVICAYPLTENFLKKLKFNGADEYKTAPRHKWYVGGNLAGYVKQAGNLTEVLVRNAGHLVPSDQPEWAYDLIYKFVRNISLHENV